MRQRNWIVRSGAGPAAAGAIAIIAAWAVAQGGGGGGGGDLLPLPTTVEDFRHPGTQPNTLFAEIQPFSSCSFCHAGWDLNAEPGRWRASMHANSLRDPLFLAAVTVANQDAPGSGDLCLRCHAPRPWVDGRIEGNPQGASPPLFESDLSNGVNCNFCHRVVDPVFEAGVSPAIDETILVALGSDAPQHHGNAQFVLDPSDVRRGPNVYDPVQGEPPHAWLHSPHHSTADMCATCHDVSNPVFDRQPDGSYKVNAFATPHGTSDPHDMFPEQRTYSEWSQSAYAQAPVDLGGRFGGNNPEVSTCQDCHMPEHSGNLCQPFFGFPAYDDVRYHAFAGANRWMPDVIEHLYPEQLSQDDLDALALQRSDVEYMLQAATNMQLVQLSGQLRVRITNYCGHKLLTGMPEGRRIWINVKFFDAAGGLLAEHGHYDQQTAVLSAADTKVYEQKLGLDQYAAELTGLAPGPSFHLTLNNTVVKDNRIPPMGFTNAGFAAVDAAHVGYSYADGQHWDDTLYAIPSGAASATAVLYYQTASKEYIEFLLNENTTDNRGQTLYDAWAATGKSPPFAMDSMSLPLGPFLLGDADGDGEVDSADLNLLLASFGSSDASFAQGDFDGDGDVDSADLNLLLAVFGQSL